ncbi:MAG: NAD+ synthase [Candidatus Methanoplasma sp.]|jgi:NAD+ synthase|nr:NAD+ synthase [Candidatus Methanoplasma sp.]
MSDKEIRQITSADVDKITEFIRSSVLSSGNKGVVVGLSGGLDSATVTKLCADALGPENVLNVFMPTTVTPTEDYKLTSDLSKQWGTRYKVFNVQPAVDAFTAMLFSNIKAPLERGNISARCRMIVLYNQAKKLGYLVTGTSNKSELYMGYFTKFGDGASDIVPMIGLYKTQVRQLAKLVGVPQEIIDRAPTAGLWEGQTDEDEMGITYHDLDLLLNDIEYSLDDKEIAAHIGLPISKITETREQVGKMKHKRVPALFPDLGWDH